MYNTLHGDVRFGGRDYQHFIRNMGRRNAGHGMGQMDDIYWPVPTTASMTGGLMGIGYRGMPDQMERMIDVHPRRTVSSTDIGYPGACLDEIFPAAYHATQIMPFERAAATLNSSLDAAIKFCREIEKQFENEMRTIAEWLDPKHIEDLWIMKLNWNGVPAFEYARNAETRAASTVVTYNKVVNNLRRAIEVMKTSSGSPALGQLERPDAVGESPRANIKKLNVTLECAEEALVKVKTHRERMAGLLKELINAQDILHLLRDYWAPVERSETRFRVGDGYSCIV